MRQRRLEGQFIKINLGQGKYATARVLKEPLIAFYDKEFDESSDEPPLNEIATLPVAFTLNVMNKAVTGGEWRVIGRSVLGEKLRHPPEFFKQDPITGAFSIYCEIDELAPTYEVPSTFERCKDLEQAAVWSASHVEDRLRDHFASRPCKWVESPRNPEEPRTDTPSQGKPK